ncbi:MAG: EVE domain-containing protein [Bacteroidia bacterium]
MNYWLVKSEPSVYSWEQLEKDGQTIWSGVRNYAARLHLNAMEAGDRVLFYHSNDGIVAGIAEVVKPAYQDPTTDDDRWVAVDLIPVKALNKQVSLQKIKAEKKLKDIALVRIGRLSVMPLKKEEFDTIIKMGS